MACNSQGSAHPSDHDPYRCMWVAGEWRCPTGGYDTVVHLNADTARAVELALKSYSSILHSRKLHREGDIIWELAKLFEQ